MGMRTPYEPHIRAVACDVCALPGIVAEVCVNVARALTSSRVLAGAAALPRDDLVYSQRS